VKVSVEELSSTRRRLQVEVPPERVRETLEEIYRDLRRRVRVKGFRAGRAPLDLIKSLYRDYAYQEAVSKLIEETLPKALEEGAVQPLLTSQVEPGSLSPSTPFSYQAIVEVKPQVDLKGYKGLKLKVKRAEKVKEEEVEAELERMRDYAAKMQPVEDRDQVVEGDWVLLDFEAFLEGRPVRDGRVENHLLEVGSGTMVPGLEEGLVGARVGEEREIPVKMPEDHPREDLAGREVTFRAKVKEIRRKVLPAIDDEFAKDMGYKDLEALRTKVKEELQRRRQEEERLALRQAALEALLEANPVESPPTLVANRAKELLQRLRERSGPSFPEEKEEELLEQCRRIAERETKVAFLVEEIAKREGIEVSEEEIGRRLTERGTPEPLKADEALRSQVKGDLLREKVFDLLVQEAEVEYVD